MNWSRLTRLTVLLFLLSGAAFAQDDLQEEAQDDDSTGQPDPLFASNEILHIRIAAPMTTLMRERPKVEELEGRLSYVDDSGQQVGIDIKIRTRGNFRHQKKICPFAPIRLNIKTSQAKDTVFHKQDKLKLVTHCRNSSSRHEQIALREYLTYRVFMLLSDTGYRVRMLRITYVDSERKGRELVRWGFVIEHKKRFTKRTGLPILEIPSTTVAELDPEYTNLVSVFQLFAGNTDFSPIAAAEGETCCHNAHLFGGGDGPIYPVPYDFDMSGLVDAPYGEPNPAFDIRSVRQRLYRGRCVNNHHLPATLQLFRDNKDAFYELVQKQPDLSEQSQKRMDSFMDQFYRLIDNPDAVQSKIVKACI